MCLYNLLGAVRIAFHGKSREQSCVEAAAEEFCPPEITGGRGAGWVSFLPACPPGTSTAKNTAVLLVLAGGELRAGHHWFLQEGQETQPSSPSVGTSSGNTPGCDRPRLNPRVLREESGKRQLAALSCPNPQRIWHLGGSEASQGPPGDGPRKGSGSPALLLGSGRRQQRAQQPLKKQAEVIFFPARLRFTPGGGLLDDALGAILGWKTQKCDRDSKAQVPRRESRQKPEDPFILAPWFVPGDESGAGVGKGFTTQQAPDGQASPIPLAGHIQKRQRNGASWLLFPLYSRSGEHPEDPPPLPLSPARPLPASRWHWQSHCPPHPAARVFPKNALRGS
nr:uncharacterized protein LOC125183047 [Anser cygnoides]